MENRKCIAINMSGRKVSGEFVRHIDNYTSVVYVFGKYESMIVERKSVKFL